MVTELSGDQQWLIGTLEKCSCGYISTLRLCLDSRLNLIKLIFINHMLDILPRTQCGVLHILHLPEHLRPPTGVIFVSIPI